jgi:hypothetical protein
MKILLLGKHKDKQEIVDMLISLKYGIYDISTLPQKFSFDQIDSDYKQWNTDDYIEALKHEKTLKMYNAHKEVLEYCYACVLMLPATDSELFLAGYLRGKNKKVIAYNNSPLVLDVNHLFLSKVISSVNELKKIFKRRKVVSLSELQSRDPVNKKKKNKKSISSNGIGKHNAKEFLQVQKQSKREGKKHFEFAGKKIETDKSHLIVNYLMNKGWV